jgi:tRNA modification GTPase
MTQAFIEDTIAAIATAPGEGAIAIVRVSGPDSMRIADRIFVGKGPPPSQRPAQSFLHGTIRGAEGVADEVILLIYRAPHSYTREDSIEIQGHGGSEASKRILRAALDQGARLADPGEFTKRAFLSGRIDLVQAEGVLDLIRARTDRAANAALEQMSGALSSSFNTLYDATLGLAADLESTLDFSEDELPESVTTNVINQLHTLEADLMTLLSTWHEGHLLREGALVVIAGRPNVGKSTLMNALLGRERSIVTPIAGTTRDIIEEHFSIDGYIVRLVDTAGLRESDCEIESEGIRRALQHLNQADLTIYVIDGSSEIDDHDATQLLKLNIRKSIIVINKCDISINKTVQSIETIWSPLFISATRLQGLDDLKEAIVSKLGILDTPEHHALISERHRRLLISAHNDIVEATQLLKRPTPDPALAASRLRGALETLGEATGRVYHSELLNNIFSRFCIGK